MNALKNSHPPKLADHLFEWYCRNELAESIQGDLHEKFYDDLSSKGLRRAQWLYWVSIIRFINPYTLKKTQPNNIHSSSNSSVMLKNYILITIRNLKRNKTYASINILGLAIGLASCFMIFSYVKTELYFDQFHSNSNRLYRVTNCFERPNRSSHWARTPPALAPAVRHNLSGIEKTTQLRSTDELLYTVGNRSFYQGNGFYADSLFLEMFDFTLKSGDRNTALDEPGAIVLTESMAVKFFGDKDPLGQLVVLDNHTPLKVTGILDPIPDDSHITFDLLISFTTYIVPEGYLADLNSWGWTGFWTYIMLDKDTHASDLEKEIASIYKTNYKNQSDIKITPHLQPLQEVYLGSSHYTNIGESVKVGNKASIMGLVLIALLILFVASVNFMNLSIAMSLRRGKEIGIRKVLGAMKSKIRRQFLIESVVISLMSLCLALLMALLLGPYVGQFFGLEFKYQSLDLLKSIPLFILGAVFIGVLAALYPSFVLSAFSPILALKGKLITIGSDTWLRKGFIVFQFVIASGLIVSTFVVVDQMGFIRNKSLGFNHQNVVKLRLSTEAGQYEVLKNKLLNNPRVLNLTRASHSFEGSASSGPAWLKENTSSDAHQLSYYQTAYDFPEVTGVKLVSGRFFSRDFLTDSIQALVLNQSAVAQLGLIHPLGQKINFHNRERVVIGVVEDFHFSSLHTPIGPMGLVMPFVNLEQVLIKVQGNDLNQTLLSLEADWHDVAGAFPFEASYIEVGIQAMYNKEEKVASLVAASSSLAIILACLGLYALVAFSVQNKLKEIGIRKVLGAPTSGLVFLMAKNYMLLILISNLLASPITYFLANQWLDGFAYRTSLEPAIFLGAGLLLILISAATIGYQLIKASMTNPIIFLRSE